jgi:hypothetical protein
VLGGELGGDGQLLGSDTKLALLACCLHVLVVSLKRDERFTLGLCLPR